MVKITAEMPYGECSDRLTAFGGLVALVKFLDLIQFESAFNGITHLPNWSRSWGLLDGGGTAEDVGLRELCVRRICYQ